MMTWVWLCCGAAGCSTDSERWNRDAYLNHELSLMVAVAPALNFSGSSDFDPVQAADLMASELAAVPGLGIIGTNRVMAVLAEQGVVQIESPEHALLVCDRLGADAILVFAITEYDAYTPVVGMVAQVYRKNERRNALDPVATSRMARHDSLATPRDPVQPVAHMQRVFNGAHEDVQDDVREYADSRGADKSPYGWRKYLRSQVLYLRYCCHRVARHLMDYPTGEPMVEMVRAEES